jgi:hypothetical protein
VLVKEIKQRPSSIVSFPLPTVEAIAIEPPRLTDLPFDGLGTKGPRLIGPNALIQTGDAGDER